MRVQMRMLEALVLSLVLPFAAGAAKPVAAVPVAYRVIVHPKNPITSMERSFLADVFLKKATRWRNGDVILPIDLRSDSPTRRKFVADVLDRSISAVRSYWQQLIFSGREIPPPELDSDQDIIDYVLQHPGAIGYVSGSANISHVKVVILK